MAGFTKLFNSILDSTIWQEPNETRLLWITMLAMSDARGEVQASIPGLARRAGITIPECEAGLSTLMSPDKFSRSKEHEGRRVEVIDGGWALLNHGKYRALLSADERREYNRKKQAEHRLNKRLNVNDVSLTVNHNKQCQHIAEAEADTEVITPQPPKGGDCGRKRFQKPTIDEVDAYGKTLTPPFIKSMQFVAHYESNGWRVGKNPMKDWRATVRTWQLKDSENNQTNGSKPNKHP